jgi:hypothetical protein
MRDTLKSRLARRMVQGLLLAIIILYLISGFGITQFRIVEAATLGLLTKPLAFKLHEYLWIPFMVLLLLHIYQGIGKHNNT